MESFTTNTYILFDKIESYVKTSIDLLKFKIYAKCANEIPSLAYRLAILSIMTMFVFFVNIGLSLYIGKLLNEYYLGFFVVSSFYLLLAIVLYFFRNKLIIKPLQNILIDKFLKDADTDKMMPTNDKN